MSLDKREYATITSKDGADKTPIRCLFNPKEYSIQRQNQYKEGNSPADSLTQLQFSGTKPATLQFQLFFDTYEEEKDVRKEYTNALAKLMDVDSSIQDPKNKFGRPPRVTFQWGSTWSFDAVITSMKQTFTLFHSNGFPVRATVDITLQQVKLPDQKPKQNPSSGGTGGERVWKVQAGDTLAWISYREYGDATKWRLIANANRLLRVRELTPGTILVIPNE